MERAWTCAVFVVDASYENRGIYFRGERGHPRPGATFPTHPFPAPWKIGGDRDTFDILESAEKGGYFQGAAISKLQDTLAVTLKIDTQSVCYFICIFDHQFIISAIPEYLFQVSHNFFKVGSVFWVLVPALLHELPTALGDAASFRPLRVNASAPNDELEIHLSGNFRWQATTSLADTPEEQTKGVDIHGPAVCLSKPFWGHKWGSSYESIISHPFWFADAHVRQLGVVFFVKLPVKRTI